MTPRHRRALAAIVVLGAAGAAVATSSTFATDETTQTVTGRAQSNVRPPRDRPTQVPTAPGTVVTPTTSPPVVATTPGRTLVALPAGTSEIAKARADLPEVIVRRDPPPGWDATLSPVLRSTEPDVPRSGADVGRVALPSADIVVPGRSATTAGWVFANPGTYRPPQPLRFGVVERQGGWVEVRLPVRPNGTSGWVEESQLELSTTTVAVQVLLSERMVQVVDSGNVVFSAPMAIGRATSPTPTGTFTVTDLVPSLDPAGPYGPVALALDGYSEVMDRFGGQSAAGSPDDEAPVLALHGTNDPGSIGVAASNGCPRLSNADIQVLASRAPPGTPVHIWP